MRGTELSFAEFTIRLGLAAALGLCIGFERQWRQKRAGLHTDSLIAIGAAIFTILDVIVPGDNTRIIAGLVTGVGFIGGGVIFRTESNVTGINTAATIWATAAIGALAGFGLFWEAATAAAIVVVLNILLERITATIATRTAQRGETVYKLSVVCRPASQPPVGRAIFSAISGSPLSLTSLTLHNAEGNSVEAQAEIFSPQPEDERIQELSSQILDMPGVDSAQWRSSEP